MLGGWPIRRSGPEDVSSSNDVLSISNILIDFNPVACIRAQCNADTSDTNIDAVLKILYRINRLIIFGEALVWTSTMGTKNIELAEF